MRVMFQRFGDLFFYLGWSGSILQFRQNVVKVGSNSWLYLKQRYKPTFKHWLCFRIQKLWYNCYEFWNAKVINENHAIKSAFISDS